MPKSIFSDTGTNDYIEENNICNNIIPVSFAIHRNKFHSLIKKKKILQELCD